MFSGMAQWRKGQQIDIALQSRTCLPIGKRNFFVMDQDVNE